jgi:hypothetical protein
MSVLLILGPFQTNANGARKRKPKPDTCNNQSGMMYVGPACSLGRMENQELECMYMWILKWALTWLKAEKGT